MKSSATPIVALVIAIIAIVGIWYWYTYASGAPSPSTTMGLNGSADQGNLGASSTGAVQQPGANTGAVLMVASSTSGSYLIASNGMTLYTTTNDRSGTSTCTSTCAATWPPYTITDTTDLTPGSGVIGNIGSLTRSDGSMQVTYDGKPLYFYVNDATTGQARGKGLGGVWNVATP